MVAGGAFQKILTQRRGVRKEDAELEDNSLYE